jgi:YD repeat-containing protein
MFNKNISNAGRKIELKKKLLLTCAALILLALSQLAAQSWRVEEVLTQDAYYGTPFEWVTVIRDAVQYRGDSSNLVDGIFSYNYEYHTQNNTLAGSRYYQYDADRTQITGLDYYNTSTFSSSHSRYRYEYDDLGRLSHRYDWFSSVDDDTLWSVQRFHYIYQDTPSYSRLSKEIKRYINYEDPMYSSYSETTFSYSGGRLSYSYVSTSEDSVAWEPVSRKSYTYHANDISDYGTVISYYRDVFPQNYSLAQSNTPDFGMVSGVTYYYWNPNPETGGWIDNAVDAFAYDEFNRLISIASGSSTPTVRWTYAYDANGNRSEVIHLSSSGNPLERFTYAWGLPTANEDEIMPNLKLSLRAYPNPFRTELNCVINSKSNAPVEAAIYNLKGQLVRSLGKQNGKSLVWDGKDTDNRTVSNGLYIIRINQDDKSACRKILRTR